MSIHHVTAATSVVAATGDALNDQTGGSLIVDPNAFLITQNLGDGADLKGFKSVTINGTVGTFDPALFGVFATALNSTDVLTMTVGAGGFLFGGSAGFYSQDEVVKLTNKGGKGPARAAL